MREKAPRTSGAGLIANVPGEDTVPCGGVGRVNAAGRTSAGQKTVPWCPPRS